MSDSAAGTIQPKFMTVAEAAEFLRLTPDALYTMVSERRVPYRKAGRRLLFERGELEAWTRPPERKRRMLAAVPQQGGHS